MADLYVSPTGDDDLNTGLSKDSPYATLQYAIESGNGLTPGDTIWMMNGNHTGSSVTWIDATNAGGTHTSVVGTSESARVYIKAYPGEVPILKYMIHLYQDSNYITFDGLTWDNAGGSMTKALSLSKQGLNDVSDNQGDATDQAWYVKYIDIKNCTIKNLDGQSVEGIRINRAEYINIENCTFDNNRTRVPGRDAFDIRLMVHLRNINIRNNRFFDCSGDNILLDDLSPTDTKKEFTNILIENNISQIIQPYIPRDSSGNAISAPWPAWAAYCGENFIDYKAGTIGAQISSVIIRNNKVSHLRKTLRSNNSSISFVGTTVTVVLNDAHTAGNHALAAGQTVFIYNVTGNGADMDGSHTVTEVPNPTTFKFTFDPQTGSPSYSGGETRLQDATGAEGTAVVVHQDAEYIEFYGNEIIDCPRGITVSTFDSSPQTLNSSKIYSNIIRDSDNPATEVALNYGAVKPLYIADCSLLNVFNNTIDYRNTSDVVVYSAYTLGSLVFIYNNIFMSGTNGTTTSKGNGTYLANCWGTNVTSSCTSDYDRASVDVNLDSGYRPPINSDVIGTGVDFSNNINKVDFYGKLHGGLPNIGAVSSVVRTAATTRTVAGQREAI